VSNLQSLGQEDTQRITASFEKHLVDTLYLTAHDQLNEFQALRAGPADAVGVRVGNRFSEEEVEGAAADGSRVEGERKAVRKRREVSEESDEMSSMSEEE